MKQEIQYDNNEKNQMISSVTMSTLTLKVEDIIFMKTDNLQHIWPEDRTEGYFSSVLLLGLEYYF